MGSIGKGFDANLNSSAQPAAVLPVDFVGGPKAAAIVSLNNKNQGGAMPSPAKPDQLLKMPGTALADGIGKRGNPAHGQGDVLYLHKARPDDSFQA